MERFKKLILGAFYGIGIAAILLTLLPYIPSNHWVFRVPDYLMIQLIFMTTSFIIMALIIYRKLGKIGKGVLYLNIGTLIILFLKLFPYFSISKEVLPSCTKKEVSVLVSNVLQSNSEYSKSIDLIYHHDPDIYIGLETDEKWVEQLSSMQDSFPYRITEPRSNTYGMTVFSKIPVTYSKVHYLVKDTIPSMEIHLQPKGEKAFRLFVIHPEPPSPTQVGTAGPKSRELIKIKDMILSSPFNGPIIVAGDFNDVPWSFTSERFKKDTPLFDVRKGRGFHSTFFNNNALLGLPLDHVLITNHFRVRSFNVLEEIGSDHLPLKVELEIM